MKLDSIQITYKMCFKNSELILITFDKPWSLIFYGKQFECVDLASHRELTVHRYNVSVAAVGNFSDEIGYLPSSTTVLPIGPHMDHKDIDIVVGPGESSFTFILDLSSAKYFMAICAASVLILCVKGSSRITLSKLLLHSQKSTLKMLMFNDPITKSQCIINNILKWVRWLLHSPSIRCVSS